ncbi:CvpA family protein [Paenactinomyces guangxiensis]|uniref:CvpA family protein n=1 Tax=Paenactinomyces guangxiensis TaxID=1490290 RepID=A0A7W1WRI6_9BACL|nr:CvpA family protein [Paenactinomyces guangxiensis]MBA4494546.1 CvpA family protein [Paenactinomyces guangxiensis]MBH8591692.1 CvpA family protein [Paenactinomyces guangxiensis]
MNLFDLILLLLLIGLCIRGYQRGLILQAASLLGFFIGIWAAYQFTDELAPVLSEILPLPDSVSSGWMALLPIDKLLYSGLAFILLLVGCKFLLSIAATLINQAAKLPVVRLFNRSGGLLLALLQAFLLFVVLVYVLNVIPWTTGQDAVKESLFAQGILSVTPDLTQSLKELFLETTL